MFTCVIAKGYMYKGNLFLYLLALRDSMSCHIFQKLISLSFAERMEEEVAVRPASVALTVVWTSGPINTPRRASAWVSSYCTSVLIAFSDCSADSHVLLDHFGGGAYHGTTQEM